MHWGPTARRSQPPTPPRPAGNATRGSDGQPLAGGIVSHLAIMAASGLSRDFVAAHMAWGAVNELSTLTGYHRMIANTEHPVLRDLLERIIKDERRHFAFYRAQARLRLAESPRAQKVTRWVLEHLWSPVGTGVRPQAETDFVIAELFGGQDGRGAIAEMDEVVHALPGLDGVGLLDRACSRVIAAP